MKNLKVILLCLFNLGYLVSAIAMTTTDSASTLLPHPNVITKAQCTRLSVNDVDATYPFTQSSLPIDNSLCTGGSGFHLVLSGPGLGAGGGQLGYQCPDDHPFLMSYTQNWGMGWGAVGATANATLCCLTPPTKVAARTSWETAPVGGWYRLAYGDNLACPP
jgi:hypothetical protein